MVTSAVGRAVGRIGDAVREGDAVCGVAVLDETVGLDEQAPNKTVTAAISQTLIVFIR